MTDKEIIDKIITTGGLEVASITATKPKHKEMVQYYCTDWDFILSRAEVNGLWVLADDGKITVDKPNLKGKLKHTFEYGISEIYEFEMEADICDQYKEVESTAWDIKTQELLPSQKAEDFSLKQGNLQGKELATTIGAENYQLISPGQLDDQELQAWADAKLQKSRLSLLKPEGFEVTEENNKKGIVTKESLKILFDDENKLIEISTPQGNMLQLSEQDKGIKMEDENGNMMTMDDRGIQIKSSKDIVIEGKNITIKGDKVDVN